MKKPVIIGIIVALLIGGGAAVYVLTREDKKDGAETSSQTNNGQTAGNSDFAPVSTKGMDFSATLTTASPQGSTSAKIEQDGDKTRYVATQDGQEIQIINTPDAYYSCTGDQCFKFALSQSGNSGVDVGSYQYDESEISNFRNTAAYQGKKDCPAGTCDVWSVTVGTGTSTLYIDTKTKRISQVESTQSGTSTKIVYDYKNVTIDIPANAQTLQTP
jgi:hypothetical protein